MTLDRLLLHVLEAIAVLGVGAGKGHGSCGKHLGATGRRVVSVADFHGDWDHAIQLLTDLRIVDRTGCWAAGQTTLVHTGDVVDRGDDSKRLLELLFRLQDEAPLQGGEVILHMGNHELMLLSGDMRYASKNDVAAYGGIGKFEQAWSSKGAIGSQIRNRTRLVSMVSDVLYVHAGLLTSLVTKFSKGKPAAGQDVLDRLNEAGRAELLGEKEDIRKSDSELLHNDGPLWTRYLALFSENSACTDLHKTLKALGARRMVVGHTPQEDGEVRSRCDGRIILADTFMSQAYTKSAKVSAHNEAAVEFFGDSRTLWAIYPQRESTCVALPPLWGSKSGFLAPAPSLRGKVAPTDHPPDATDGGGGAPADALGAMDAAQQNTWLQIVCVALVPVCLVWSIVVGKSLVQQGKAPPWMLEIVNAMRRVTRGQQQFD